MKFFKLKKRWAHEVLRRKQISRNVRATVAGRGISLFQKHGIEKVILGGSIQDDRGTEASDPDILAIPLANQHYRDFRPELEHMAGFAQWTSTLRRTIRSLSRRSSNAER